jgi:hypothetical protein
MQHIILLISMPYLLLQVRSTLPPRPPAASAVDEIIFKGFPFEQNTARGNLERAFGNPASVSENPEKKLSTLRFDGLIVELVEREDHSQTVSAIELSDNRWRFPAKVRIGSLRDEILKLLGKPDIEHPSEFVYGCYECVYDHKIHFFFDGDKVKRIKWDFYLP